MGLSEASANAISTLVRSRKRSEFDYAFTAHWELEYCKKYGKTPPSERDSSCDGFCNGGMWADIGSTTGQAVADVGLAVVGKGWLW